MAKDVIGSVMVVGGGISGMQAVSLKNNMSALNRSNALFLAGSIMDRIRANPTGDYVIAFADDPPANMTTCTTAGSSCSTDQIADLHLTLWRCMLGGYQAHIACAGTEPVMPDAQGQIALVGGNYVIEIRYVDRVSYNNGVQETSGQPVT